jgi:pyruvate,water dikinase
MTDPDWEPIMKKASAIITNKGGRTCHAAIVAREMGVPAIVGCGNATDLLDTGMEVTASCCEGDTGIIYERHHPLPQGGNDALRHARDENADHAQRGEPGSGLQVRGPAQRRCWLAREEFIINNYIQAHPLALCNTRNWAMWPSAARSVT